MSNHRRFHSHSDTVKSIECTSAKSISRGSTTFCHLKTKCRPNEHRNPSNQLDPFQVKKRKWLRKQPYKCNLCDGVKSTQEVQCIECKKIFCSCKIRQVSALCSAMSSSSSDMQLSSVCSECFKTVDLKNIWHLHLSEKKFHISDFLGTDNLTHDTCDCGASSVLTEIFSEEKCSAVPKAKMDVFPFHADMEHCFAFSDIDFSHFTASNDFSSKLSLPSFLTEINPKGSTFFVSTEDAIEAKDFAKMVTMSVKDDIFREELEECEATELLSALIEKVQLVREKVIEAAMIYTGQAWECNSTIEEIDNVEPCDRLLKLKEYTKELSNVQSELKFASENLVVKKQAALRGTSIEEVESMRFSITNSECSKLNASSLPSQRKSVSQTKIQSIMRHSLNITAEFYKDISVESDSLSSATSEQVSFKSIGSLDSKEIYHLNKQPGSTNELVEAEEITQKVKVLGKVGIAAKKYARNGGKCRDVYLRIAEEAGTLLGADRRVAQLFDSVSKTGSSKESLYLHWGTRKFLNKNARSIPINAITAIITFDERGAEVFSPLRNLRLQFSNEKDRNEFVEAIQSYI